MVVIFVIFVVVGIICESFGYYYAPSPFGISSSSSSQVWPQQRAFASSTNYYNGYYNSPPFAAGNPSQIFSSGGNYVHQRAQYCADLRLFREANYLMQKAALNQTDIDLVVERAQEWDIEGVKNEIFDIVNSKFDIEDRNRSLQLLDILSPPRSFTDALEVLTIEQKSHIEELFKTYRYQDLSIVVNGLIKSIPDEKEHQARRFVQAVHYISQHFPRSFY